MSNKVFVCECDEHQFTEIVQVLFPKYFSSLHTKNVVQKDRLAVVPLGIKCELCNKIYYYPLDASLFKEYH